MIIVDNKEHIIKQIESNMQIDIQEVEKEYDQKLLEFQNALNKKLVKKIKELDVQIGLELINTEKQRVNNFELEQTHRVLLKQNDIYSRVIEKLKQKAMNNKKVINLMIKILEKNSDEKIKELRVPKSIDIRKNTIKSELDEFKVIGIVNKNFSLELDFDDLLDLHQNELNKLITKELF